MSSQQLTIKAYYLPSTEIRRFHLSETAPFSALRERLLSHLPAEKRSREVTIKYLDDEDEWVTISEMADEEEWRTATTVFKQPILRLRVCLLPDATPQSPPSDRQFHLFTHRQGGCHRKPAHWGVVCDGCGARPIRGMRYKCDNCPNFDFCETCFARAKDIHDASHTFTKHEMRRWGGHGGHCLMRRYFESQAIQPQQQQQPQPQPSSEPSLVSTDAGAAPKEPTKQEPLPEKVAAEEPAPAVVPEPAACSVPSDVAQEAKQQQQQQEPAPESFLQTGVNWWGGFFAPPSNNGTEPANEFASELAILEEMGLLDDRDRAIRLLRRRNGNLQLVINKLLR